LAYSDLMLDSSTANRLRSLLERDGRRWAAPIEHHRTIDSTNRRLKEWSRDGAPDRAVVVAEEQTAGRGRQGRNWISPPGNVYLSLLVRGDWIADRPYLLSLIGGVAAADALARFGLSPQLKWPNDVCIRDRKIAGLLSEIVPGAHGIDAVVVGVGVNVNLARDDLPPAMIDQTTSLRLELGVMHDSLVAAAFVLARMNECYDALAQGEWRKMLFEWRRFSVPWWGCLVEAHVGEEKILGVMEDLGTQGELIIRLQDGSVRQLYADGARMLRRSAEEVR
jgi:BirA family biotin operon repressor/biotin-[acetyl-CoA-carboxylase] ligase